MSALRELQSAFAGALLGGDARGVASAVVSDGLAGAARLRIYQHHVLATLTAVLQGTYPVVCRLVDERFFAYAASEFVPLHPPASPCLFEYGEAFPAFLADFPPCRDLGYLPDVARFEWAVNVAAHADEPAPVDPAALGGLSAAACTRLGLRLHPALSLLDSAWPVDAIWRANQPDADPDATVDLTAGGVCLEICRRDGDVTYRRLDPATYALRCALGRGATLEVAAAEALDRDADLDLAVALRDLLGEGLVVGFEVPPTPTEVSPC